MRDRYRGSVMMVYSMSDLVFVGCCLLSLLCLIRKFRVKVVKMLIVRFVVVRLLI